MRPISSQAGARPWSPAPLPTSRAAPTRDAGGARLACRVWRIATDAPAYQPDDLTGTGAKLTAGRWNERDMPAVYAAENRSLACLETMAHLKAGGLPLNRYLVEIAIPDEV